MPRLRAWFSRLLGLFQKDKRDAEMAEEMQSHLDKIFQGEIGESIGIYFSAVEIFRKRAMSILRKLRQAFIEHDAIFKRRVHSLAVERNDRMGGIADQTDLVLIEPRRATDRD